MTLGEVRDCSLAQLRLLEAAARRIEAGRLLGELQVIMHGVNASYGGKAHRDVESGLRSAARG
jgi:hypothetical protein